LARVERTRDLLIKISRVLPALRAKRATIWKYFDYPNNKNSGLAIALRAISS